MNDDLKAIDRELITLEELMLSELRRLRKQESEETYSAIEPTLMKQLRADYTGLVGELEGSADWSNLSLKSFEQEWIEDRMKVIRNLLTSKLPTAFLSLSHEEHKQTRKSDFATDDHQASLELAILSEQVNLHHVEGQSISQIVQDRAEFGSRELSKGHAQESIREKKAQSAEELKRKLEGKTGVGTSSFGGRDVQNLSDTISDIPKKNIAQSPDEIRRKLQERGAASSQGASTFEAKDLSGGPSQPAFQSAPVKKAPPKEKGPIAQTPEEIRRKLAERQAAEGDQGGKAVFGAKDLSAPPPPTPGTEKKPKEEDKPKTGKATFESRDLSNPKP